VNSWGISIIGGPAILVGSTATTSSGMGIDISFATILRSINAASPSPLMMAMMAM
jgi:hypothetical protein